MQQVFDISKRQRKPDIEHHRQADDLETGFEVTEGAALRHNKTLRNRPARFNPVSFDNAYFQKPATPRHPQVSRQQTRPPSRRMFANAEFTRRRRCPPLPPHPESHSARPVLHCIAIWGETSRLGFMRFLRTLLIVLSIRAIGPQSSWVAGFGWCQRPRAPPQSTRTQSPSLRSRCLIVLDTPRVCSRKHPFLAASIRRSWSSSG